MPSFLRAGQFLNSVQEVKFLEQQMFLQEFFLGFRNQG